MKNLRQVASFDDCLDALAHVQRRKLLIALTDHNPQNDIPFSATDAENDIDPFERLVQMRHRHLPKLADYGFIEWDEESHEVSKGPNFDEIKPILELLVAHEDELPSDWL